MSLLWFDLVAPALLAGFSLTGAKVGGGWRRQEWPCGVAAGWKKRPGKKSARQFGQTATGLRPANRRLEPKKRVLKPKLKIAHRTETFGKYRSEMLDRLAQRISVGTGWGFLSAAQPAANVRQAEAQPLQQMVDRFQGKGQAQILNRGLDASVGQKLNQEFAQQCGPNGVARQHVSQEDRKCFSATAATTSVRTEDPLAAAEPAAIVFCGIIAVEDTVPVQRFILAAAWTALLLERKSSSFSFAASATKRKGRDMGRFGAGTKTLGRDFFYGACSRRDSVHQDLEKKRGGADGTLPALRS